MNKPEEISSSNFIFNGETNDSWNFTDHQKMACRGVNNLFCATHKGCRYLLKGLKEEYQESPTHQLQMLKEYRLGKSLKHAHVVQTYGMVDDDVAGRCIVMEYIEGGNLKQWLATKPSAALRHKVFMETLDALDYCHAKQVTHCDIKPSNIMVTDKGNNVKVIDFGLSDNDSYLIFKQSGGTRGYMAPEQQAEAHTTDPRTDIYALGCLMGELFPCRYFMLRSRCKRHNPQHRPQNINQLRKAYLAWRALPWTICTAAAIIVAIVLWPRNSQAPTEKIVTTEVVVHDTIAVHADTASPTAAASEPQPSKVDATQQLAESLEQVYRNEIKHCLDNEGYSYDIFSEIRRRCNMATNKICASAPQNQQAYLRSKSSTLQQQLDEQYSSELHQCRLAIAMRNR